RRHSSHCSRGMSLVSTRTLAGISDHLPVGFVRLLQACQALVGIGGWVEPRGPLHYHRSRALDVNRVVADATGGSLLVPGDGLVAVGALYPLEQCHRLQSAGAPPRPVVEWTAAGASAGASLGPMRATTHSVGVPPPPHRSS